MNTNKSILRQKFFTFLKFLGGPFSCKLSNYDSPWCTLVIKSLNLGLNPKANTIPRDRDPPWGRPSPEGGTNQQNLSVEQDPDMRRRERINKKNFFKGPSPPAPPESLKNNEESEMNEIASMLNLKPMSTLRKTLTTNGWKVNFRDYYYWRKWTRSPLQSSSNHKTTLMNFNTQSDELQDLRAGRRTFAQRIHGKATHCLVCEARK